MPSYSFHLDDGSVPTGEITNRELVNDEAAVQEASVSAGEVLVSKLSDSEEGPSVVVTVDRDGKRLAIVRAYATIERYA